MTKTKSLLFLFTCLLTSLSLAASIDKQFDDIKSNPSELYAFLKAMPKGGELHYHLAGSAYPKTMLDIAAINDYCLNKKTLSVRDKKNQSCNKLLSSEKLHQQPKLYQAYVRAWSTKDFIADNNESNHDHFFNAFEKFMPIVSNQRAELLAKIIERAANQNEQYLEIMAIPDNGQSIAFGNNLSTQKTYQEKLQSLVKNPKFEKNIQYTIKQGDDILHKAYRLADCEKNPNAKVCSVVVKFQYYTLREIPLDNFFAMAVTAFEAAKRSNNFVGINMVQPEDSLASLQNIKGQMAILNFLHQKYPTVNISLHAGEITVNNVPPYELRYHINDAVKVAHAKRIGHGVDITREHNANELAKLMAKKGIAVEINLSSNAFILGIKGKDHPLNYYLKHKVPVVLSTDDEGILRTDLTTEYVRAVTEQGLNYKQLKNITRNSLSYSFLPGKSIWQNPATYQLVSACKNLQSKPCQQTINDSKKAQLQWQLERKLQQFETKH